MDLIIDIVILLSATAMVILPLVKDVIKREQNVIAQKKRSRIIKKTNAENKYTFFKKLTWSGRWLFFAAVITIGFSIWAKIRDGRQRKIVEKNKKDLENKLTDEIKKLRYTIDTLSDDPSERVSEGFSLFSVLQVGDIFDRRRKFIFDCGESTSLNRLSLYLDYDNSLVFAIIDNSV